MLWWLWPKILQAPAALPDARGCAKSFMTGRTFVDTNVVVYAFDDADSKKQEIARSVLSADSTNVISTQVIGEFYVVVTRKLATPLSGEQARAAVEQLLRFPVVPIDGQLTRDAVTTCLSEQLSYWDALIVEAAIASGCNRLLSEDLGHGRQFRSVSVENPFVMSEP